MNIMRNFSFNLLIFTFIQIGLFGQSASVLTNSVYLDRPRQYLSKLDTAKIQSDILIDRVFYNDVILNTNGSDKVTTITCAEWANMYTQLKYANYDTLYLSKIDTIGRAIDLFYQSNMIDTIGLLDFRFKRITQTAIDNNELIERSDFLYDNNATSNSFSNYRVVAASCLNHNIYGDNVKFVLNDFFYLTNNFDQTLQSVEIDFGNGEGFRNINRNEIINVAYNSSSEYIHIVIKLVYKNISTLETETLYSHSSVFRTGSSTIPLPDILPSQADLKSTPIEPNRKILYPVGSTITRNIGCHPCGRYGNCCGGSREVPGGFSIESYFLFNPNNTSGKLRRPFIICDGFDPGNRRDYYTYRYDNPGDLLEKEKDFRGLFQLLNGDTSPWYNTQPDGNLVELLRNDGYDIVIINFVDGAGDIPTNANALRGFFNSVLNSSQFRDNKTEEAILIGPSMGGLITRYALTSMEKANPKEEHFVKSWISFDSPQKGAYIPLGLQHAINFLTKIHDGGGLISALTDARESFLAGVNSLNTKAAQQMLLYHFTQTNSQGNHTTLYDNLYSQLDQLGFPIYSKNHAISNGGKSKLYEGEGSPILDFKIFPWTWAHAWGNQNTDGAHLIFNGSRQGYFNDESNSTNSQIAYENAPGGWNSALYTLNCNSGNKNKKSDTDKKFTKTTFMVTSSAFGIPVTRNNVFNTWEAYTGCSDNSSGKIKTPFDKIHGMEENEEHVRISPATCDYLRNDVLHPEFDNMLRPVVRDGQPIIQNVKGKVAYVAKQSLTFAGSGNSFTIENGADVTAVAGNSITLMPGFQAKEGATFSASIKNIDYGTTLKSGSIRHKSIDYTKPSPYTGKVFDYSNRNEPPKLLSPAFLLSVSPNPVSNLLQINIDGIENENVIIKIVSVYGHIVLSSNFTGSFSVIDVSQLACGVYFVKAFCGSYSKTVKIMKL